LETVTRHHSKRIAIYNHKGGVGKTILTVNIAAAIASSGKRVLIVDSDPQCNLTAYLIEEPVVDQLLDDSSQPNGRTIWSALKSISEATGDVRVVEPYERMNNLFILPGDILLSEFEEDLTQFWDECFRRKARGFKGTTSLSLLVNSIAEKHQIDYVFYDMGPNIGPLNRIILLDCDYFIIPMACDLFSTRALKTLGNTLRKWIQDWQTISELAPKDIYLFDGKPKFLGYIIQRFRVYRGQISNEQAKYLSKIEKQVHSEIVTILRKIETSLASDSMAENKIGEVKNFESLATAAQTQGVPFQNVNSGNPEQRNEARKAFNALAKKIIQRTNKK
jgi:cellulose biosynthesis protein BcsQ